MATQPPKYVVAVHEPTEDTEKNRKFQTIHDAVSTSTFYTTPGFPFATFQTNINTSIATLAASKLVPPTATTAQAHDAIRLVETEVEIYRSDCQKLCNADVIHAHQIADSFNMELKHFHGSNPRVDHIERGTDHLTAEYFMKGTGPHQVQISYDAGMSSTDLNPTRKGHAVVSGLSPKKDIWLRNRQILPHDLYGEWSNWLKFTPLD